MQEEKDTADRGGSMKFLREEKLVKLSFTSHTTIKIKHCCAELQSSNAIDITIESALNESNRAE